MFCIRILNSDRVCKSLLFECLRLSEYNYNRLIDQELANGRGE